MFRRSSYAEVAAGSSGHSQNSGPTRSGAFAHLANLSSNMDAPQFRHSRHLSRSLDADGHHHSSMAHSWGRDPPLASALTTLGPSTDFFVPSYLKGSRYARKVEQAHRAKMVAQRSQRSTLSSNTGSLSTSASSVTNFQRSTGSHRGLTHEVVERPPRLVDEISPSWPTRWNEMDKYTQMELDETGRQAKFSGAQKTHDEAASVRADFPMPVETGIYYYEVTVASKGKDG